MNYNDLYNTYNSEVIKLTGLTENLGTYNNINTYMVYIVLPVVVFIILLISRPKFIYTTIIDQETRTRISFIKLIIWTVIVSFILFIGWIYMNKSNFHDL